MTKSILIEHLTSYVAQVVNVCCFAVIDAQDTIGQNRNELAVLNQQSVTWLEWELISPHNSTTVIDATSRGQERTRILKGFECELSMGRSNEKQQSE